MVGRILDVEMHHFRVIAEDLVGEISEDTLNVAKPPTLDWYACPAEKDFIAGSKVILFLEKYSCRLRPKDWGWDIIHTGDGIIACSGDSVPIRFGRSLEKTKDPFCILPDKGRDQVERVAFDDLVCAIRNYNECFGVALDMSLPPRKRFDLRNINFDEKCPREIIRSNRNLSRVHRLLIDATLDVIERQKRRQ